MTLLRFRPAALLTLALALGACSSTPTRYYTLIAPAGPSPQASSAPTALQFEVQPVLMPVQVDQPPLVVRQGNGSLAILDTDRWGSPLGDEFHDALVAQLERELGSRDLAGLPKDREQPLLSLRTDVRRFESVPDRHALIDVVWNLSLRDADGKRRNLICSSVISQNAGVGIENLVLAHQQAVAALGQRIARTATAWARNPATHCPA